MFWAVRITAALLWYGFIVVSEGQLTQLTQLTRGYLHEHLGGPPQALCSRAKLSVPTKLLSLLTCRVLITGSAGCQTV